MQTMILTSKIILQYECKECEETAEQYLCEIVEAGTAICPECGDDMELEELAIKID